jgi:hypothetical protein
MADHPHNSCMFDVDDNGNLRIENYDFTRKIAAWIEETFGENEVRMNVVRYL